VSDIQISEQAVSTLNKRFVCVTDFTWILPLASEPDLGMLLLICKRKSGKVTGRAQPSDMESEETANLLNGATVSEPPEKNRLV
jgi:hypothetical protein